MNYMCRVWLDKATHASPSNDLGDCKVLRLCRSIVSVRMKEDALDGKK